MAQTKPLVQKHCQPCEGMEKPLARDQAAEFLTDTPGWRMNEAGRGIFREYTMKNFTTAVSAIQKIAEVAERENHHPDIHLTGYRNLRIDLSTHAIGGLSENDFIVAAKLNELPFELKK